jgi:hypothetical protein
MLESLAYVCALEYHDIMIGMLSIRRLVLLSSSLILFFFLLLICGWFLFVRPQNKNTSIDLKYIPTVLLSVSDPRILLGYSKEDRLMSEIVSLYGTKNWMLYENKQGQLTPYTVNKLTVDLVDVQQPWIGMYLGEKDMVFSKFNLLSTGPGEATLYLYLEPSAYSEDESLSDAVNLSLRMALYAVGNWESYSSNDARLSKYTSKIIDEPPIITLVRLL